MQISDCSYHESSLLTIVLIVFLPFQRFKEVLNGLADARWSVIESDGVDDVCISVTPSLSKVINCMQLSIMDYL